MWLRASSADTLLPGPKVVFREPESLPGQKKKKGKKGGFHPSVSKRGLGYAALFFLFGVVLYYQVQKLINPLWVSTINIV